MPIPIAQITICSTTFFTSGSLARVYCPTFTFIITASKVSFTLVRTSLELCLEGIGKEVSSAVSVTLDPVRKAFVFTRCPITESAQKARGQEEGNSTHLKTETFQFNYYPCIVVFFTKKNVYSKETLLIESKVLMMNSI